MNFIAWSSFTLFPLHVLLAAYMLQVSPRTKANWLFASVNLPLGIWAIAHGFYVLAPDKATAWFYYYIATAAWLVTPSVIFHFLLELTGAWSEPRQRCRALLLAYAIAAALLARLYYAGKLLDSDIARGSFGWYEKSDLGNPWAIAVLVSLWGLVIVSMVLVYRWQRLSIRRLERLQGRVIVVSGLSSLAAVILYATVLPTVMPTCQISTLSSITIAFLILGMWHAITRYGLLRISPAIAAENILQTMTEPLVITDEEQCVVRVNTSLEALLGIPAEELLRRPLGCALSASSIAPAEWKRRLDQDELRDQEVQFQRPDGKEFTLVVSGTRVQDRRRTSSGYVVVMRDITALKKAEERLRHLATHDPLTELPNRVLLKDRAEQALARAQRNHTSGALLMLDLNGFKEINDTHGHEAGDEILRQVASRCKRTLRATDTIARLGGDEFVALLTDLKHSEDAEIGVQRLECALTQPIVFGKHTLTIGVSIGMSIFPGEGEDLDTLMKIADSAMYVVKEGAKNPESATMRRQASPPALEARHLAVALPLALDKKEFELWYQTLHSAADGSIVGTEALLRWRHPTFGTVGPLQFLPVAERSGLIVPIGTWVLRMACRQNKSWETDGLMNVPVAVNVSVKRLIRVDFVETVHSVLGECELEPSHLQIEISETAAMHDLSAIKSTLVALNALGVRIVIDDFGSGYAALSHLSALSVHAIKINQFLIRNMANEPRDATVVRAIVSMANAFGIRVIAKGVETESQLDLLRGLRWDVSPTPACDMIQGFVFSRPVPARDFAPLLAARQQPEQRNTTAPQHAGEDA